MILRIMYHLSMCRIVSFISGAGGLGQTSIIFELSKRLAERKFNVCVIDGYFNLNSISLKLNTEGVDLKEYISGNASLNDVLITAQKNLKFVKTNCATFDYLSHFEQIKYFMLEISEQFDYILIDVNSVGKKQLSLALESSNEVVLIMDNDPYCLRNGAKLLQKVYLYKNILNINIVLNKMKIIAEMNNHALGEEDISDIFKIEPLFVFPKFYKYNVFNMANSSTTNSIILDKFCSSFITNQRRIIDYKKKYHGLIGFFRRKLYEKFE